MIQKKICMLGSFSVGKTSLVRRFVKSIFDEKYLTTIGVKIDKKTVAVDGTDVMLMLWDLEGEDDFQKLRMSYLRGAAGYLLVADGTRKETLAQSIDIHQRVNRELGDLPFLLLLNKSDLAELWELPENDVEALQDAGVNILRTSAKTGQNVEQAFLRLAKALIS